MKKSGWLLIIGLGWLVLALIGFGCGAKSEEEVRLGINAELTGSKPTVGDSCKKAAELLALEINQAGGLKVGDKNIPIKLIIEDNEDKAESAAAVAQKLISQNNVLAILGPNASGNAIPAARICEDSGVIMISPWSTNPKTTEGKKFIFRACFIDDFQGQVMAKFARQELQAKTAAVLYDVASEYNKGIAEFFKRFFEADGGTVVAFASYTTGDKDFSSQLTTIKAADPDVLFLPNYYNEVPLQVKQARNQGLTCAIIGSDSWGSQDLLNLGGPDLEGAFFSTHYAPDIATPKAQKFIKEFEAKYGKKPDDVAALTYDAGLLLCNAITQAGSLDRTKVRDALAQVQEFEGVTGKMAFKGTGDPVKSAVILQVKDGQFKYFASVQP
ncbi:MAG: ABC transporter substrate-binding protein [Deltaproteobacteria bacterium]|nr:ABC transporter substrate-binding protein [Deltaproteobacteria bacterium]